MREKLLFNLKRKVIINLLSGEQNPVKQQTEQLSRRRSVPFEIFTVLSPF